MGQKTLGSYNSRTRDFLKIVFETEEEKTSYQNMLRQLTAEPLSDANIGPARIRKYAPLGYYPTHR